MIYALPGWRWPHSTREVFPWIFNVADMLLCTGVGLMVILSLFHHKPAGSSPRSHEEHAEKKI
jgi:lipoprotein signal peptidase